MSNRFWSAVTRFVACVVAVLMTSTFVVYGRNWLAAETRTLQAPQLPPAGAPVVDENKVKTPLVRSMLEAMKNLENGDGTDDERRFVREQLLKADEELSTSLGGNTRNAIMKANNRLPAFRIPKGNAGLVRGPRRSAP